MKSAYPLSQICRNLGVSRQAVYKRSTGERSKGYRKADDTWILPLIQKVIESRPTYGYKRVTAMVNRAHGLKLNKKRIGRIMKRKGLLLPKSSPTRREHTGTGKVQTLHSNTRWCSDAFEIKCFNDERVYVAFSLDCKDREALFYVAQKQPLTARDIQQLMIASVEKRFGQTQTPRTIEWLTDRGGIYRAHTVLQLAQWVGLKPCFTPAYSPASNGMAEAFVGTFKRDYVYVNDCVSADWVLKHLSMWFHDYNHIAPHSALEMKSPCEYRKLHL